MSNNWKQQPELQLMEVSQDCTSISHQLPDANLWTSPLVYSADDWGDSWNGTVDGDEFVDIDEIADTDIDGDIIDFSSEEY